MSIQPDLNLEVLVKDVHAALSAWGKPGSTEQELMGFLRLVREKEAGLGGRANSAALRQAANQVLLDGLQRLEEQDATGTRVLRWRFRERLTAQEVAQRLHASRDRVNDWQQAAIAALAGILYYEEMALRQAQVEQVTADLPPLPDTPLFGLERATRVIGEQLRRDDGPWLVAITGIGGIGKTTLADAVARQLAQTFTFQRIVWLRAGRQNLGGASAEAVYEGLLADLSHRLWPERPGVEAPAQRLARLRQALKEQPHLIVIDNLETEAEVAVVLERAPELVRPSRFLLTTRVRPLGPAAFYTFSVDELALPEAADLLAYQAEVTGLADLAEELRVDAPAIYGVTGGNPLALKLVVGLAKALPLAQILADLQRSRPGAIETLYRHIYWEAWRALNSAARTLLQAMPLVGESGALLEQMQAMSGLEDEAFSLAVAELYTRSLLEARGTARERRYGIHRLTESFLRTEIIHWPE